MFCFFIVFLFSTAFPNNHTTVWGSYWEDGRWGFACCHQFIKAAYCTGLAGIEARKQSDTHAAAEKPAFQAKREDDRKREEIERREHEQEREREREQEQDKGKDKDKDKKSKEKSLQESMDERVWKKRKYNSMESHEFTDDDYLNYLKKKEIFDDPMKNYADSETS